MFRSLKATKERTKIRFVLWKEMNGSVEDRAGMRGSRWGRGAKIRKTSVHPKLNSPSILTF